MPTHVRSALAALGLVAAVAAALLMTGGRSATALQDAAPVPAPEEVVGFEACADYRLATYEQIARYFRRVDEASDRVQVRNIGRSTEGRQMLLAVVSSEQNMQSYNLVQYQEIARRLARAKGLTDEQARTLSYNGKPVVWVDYGIHSTENASQQAAMMFLHRLVTDDSPEMRSIRDNVITLVVPSLNPDGNTMIADWYREHRGQEWELSLPELYQRYAGHDNNRDWYMFNLQESRNVARQLYEEWLPQIVHDNHQSAPFPARIFVPPFEDPPNPSIQPRTVRNINLIGDAMTRRLDQEGKVGAISRNNFDLWWNGGMRTAPSFHNMVGILTETAHTNPAPEVYDPADFPERFSNGELTDQPSMFYPSPYRGGEWHLRDSCDYMTTATFGLLEVASEKPDEFLYDMYQMGRDAIREGEDETYVMSARQRDFATAVKLVNVLRMGGIEVEQATEPFRAGGRDYPAGSFVVRGAQGFRSHLNDLLNPQVYPDRRLYPGGPPEPPYDITGWTLPMQMGVEVDKLATPVSAATRPVNRARPPAGAVTGEGEAFALDPRVNDAFTAVNRLLQAGEEVSRATEPVETAAGTWPAGTFLVTAADGTAERLGEITRSLGLTAAAVAEAPDSAVALRLPRIGLYHAWGGNMDEGWTRYMLEDFEFPYERLHDADVRAGNLDDRFDVIVLPDASYNSMLEGEDPGDLPPQYTGGMTQAGVNNIAAFAQAGGVVVTMDSATSFARQALGVNVTDVTAGHDEEELFIPGTLLRLNVDNTKPIGWGMPSETAAFFADSPAFSVPAGSPATTVASYAEEDLLMSGWLLGEEFVEGTSAVLDAPVGNGRAVLLGFRTQHRAQAHGTYKLLFNSIYLGGMADD
jgi:hypothetical protein